MENKSLERRLKRGFAIARRITKKHSHTFYFASRFLPREKRMALYSAYALCRLSDDAVDEDGPGKKERLRDIKEKIDLCYGTQETGDDLLLCFRHTVKTYGIPKSYFEDLMRGMEMDLSVNRYQDFGQLYSYCYNVAGVIGLIILAVFGNRNEDARRHAVELGVAVQLTNIIRDIGEDASRDRIYLPQDEMQRSGVTEKSLKDRRIDRGFKEFLAFQIRRARQYYDHSAPGILLVDSYVYRLVILAIKENYAKILDDVQQHDYDVFSRRAHVPTVSKIICLGSQLIKAFSHES